MLQNILEKIKLPYKVVYAMQWAQGIPVVLLITPFVTLNSTAFMLQLTATAIWMFWIYGLVRGHNSRWFNIVTSAFLKNTFPVEIIDYEGQRYFSIAEKTHDDKVISFVYLFAGAGPLNLNKDGTISDSYCEYWLPLKKSDRVWHLLKYDLPSKL